MNLLLDTHVFLWLNDTPEKLSPAALAACQDENNTLFLSLASAWEIQIKQQLGKLELSESLHTLVTTQQQQNGLQLLPIEMAHIEALSQLPSVHRDPFDRLLIAQSIQQHMQIVSADQVFTGYPVELIW
ncbi:MAG: type II toxin-antitoxin system VapC family toxin [Methylomonas sp.]|nr:type II toxin-antitoxin system VapC family toxin [Methylomonas sp.]PPD23364.1 MAG: PIN domain nuclease [Methylomonas sp.]PPD50526.1 MAG: PIN domain nuclease [Methylobacter sp.]PPD53526.1 MAG: PIN domain nuclease [Methylotenera sp.]